MANREPRSPTTTAGGGRDRARRSPRRLAWLAPLAALAVVAVVAIVAASSSNPPASIPATVTGPDAHARTGPSPDSPSRSEFAIGQHISVRCHVDGTGGSTGWDRLATPFAGSYVAASLVQPTRPVPPC